MMRRALGALSVIALVACPRARSAVMTDGACADGSTFVLGACVPYAMADSFCGPASKFAPGGGCARKACAAGEALDVDHGLCLPASGVLKMLLHGDPRDDEPKTRATCMYGVLENHGAQLLCAAGAPSCTRGERYVKATADAGVNVDLAGRCEPTPPCSAAEIFSEREGKCERVVRGDSVDVGTWARLAIGVDGAEGTNAFCAPVRAAGAAGSFQIELTVSDNDVTQTVGKVMARPGTPPQAGDAAAKSIERLVEILHFYGGSTLAAAVSLSVSCTPGLPGRPTADIIQDSLDAGR